MEFTDPSIMAEERDDDFNDQVVVKSKRFDGAIIKPILQDIIRSDPPDGEFKRKFLVRDDSFSQTDKTRINREMLTKINSNLVLGNIDHPLLTWNQLKDYIRRAENEEKEMRVKQKEWHERQEANCGFQDDDDPFPFPDYEWCFISDTTELRKSVRNGQCKKMEPPSCEQ